MAQSFIIGPDLTELMDRLEAHYSVYILERGAAAYHYIRYAGKDSPGVESIELGEIRSCEPLKAFFFDARKTVSIDYKDSSGEKVRKPRCIVGVKSCDLSSLKVLDSVFIDEDYTDPFYAKAREETLIISSDCTAPVETCFCTALHIDPYPGDGYDLNLSAVEGGYVVDVGTGKGTNVLDSHKDLFTPAEDRHEIERGKKRAKIMEQVKLGTRDVPDLATLDGAIKRSYESNLWREEGENCVECGACNVVCPTCHCFLLYDQQHDGQLKRFRQWDSCLIKDFAQVAGGANPRPYLWMRLRNRFEKKFEYFPAVKNLYACTGCGRCINACPGNIDIRRVLKRNVESVPAR